MGKVIGYARVSSDDQDLTIQREALDGAGCSLVLEEKVSGTSMEGREQLDLLLKLVGKGDTVMVTRIDRLARSMHDLQVIVRQLRDKKVALKATEQPIDTSTAAGKAFFDMLGVFSEFETNLRRERQAEGIARAKREGVYRGAVVRTDHAKVHELHAAGVGKAQIARDLGISRRHVYRVLERDPAEWTQPQEKLKQLRNR